MAGFRKDKTTVAQTAANTAAEVTAALVTAGVIKSTAKADEYLESRYNATLALLTPVVDADNELFAKVEGQDKPAPRGGGGRKPATPSEPGEVVFFGGKFKGCTIAEVMAMSEETAKEVHGHPYGDGSTYIKNYVATDKNTNETTREAAKSYLAALQEG
jgi:hypothetical protein